MGAILLTAQTDTADPLIDEPRILARADVISAIDTAILIVSKFHADFGRRLLCRVYTKCIIELDLRFATGAPIQWLQGLKAALSNEVILENDVNQTAYRFALTLAKNLEQNLNERLIHENSKRPRVLTEIHIVVTIEATMEVVAANPPYPSWPANEPPTIEVSADKETQWLRETLEKSGRDVTFGPCLGSRLDLQIRQGDRVLVNMETELGGNRQRAEDMAKLTEHDVEPLASIIMIREKSYKNLDGVSRNLAVASADRAEPFITVVEHWPLNQPLNTTKTIVDVIHRGRAFQAVATNEIEQDDMDAGEMDEDEWDDPDLTNEVNT
jgi:hypothetical protein